MSESQSIELVLPDGSKRAVAPGTTALEVARSIGPRLARDAVGAELGGAPIDLRTPITGGGAFRLFTTKSAEAGEFLRHSAEHVLADAVKRLWPEVEIDAGRQDHSEKFQYDFRFPRAFTSDDLEAIEAKMLEILAEDSVFERQVVSRREAADLFSEMGETLKLERLQEIPDGEPITVYRHGRFADLCRGPHAQRSGQIKAIKLLEASGAYLRGDESGEMLQRIYGTAFGSRQELDEYLDRIEQAKLRDHRRLGPDLDLFSFNAHAPASPFFHPKGAFVYNALVDFVRRQNRDNGYDEVITPQILDVDLWHRSGHYDNYREAMYFAEVDERQYAVKPMNCPTHCLIYANSLRSYRDLPIRYADFGRLHRYERSGQTSGLTRVRSFAQDDAHVFCSPEQVEEEVLSAISIILDIYRTFGFGEVLIELSTRPDKRLGTDELWDRAERDLASALESAAIEYEINEGDGAFYGPKVDFQIKDAIGRYWQLGTVQLDYHLPERFDLSFIGEDGGEHRPVMIHRAMLGSVERFLAILIEHTAGAFPVWLAPVQAVVLPVTDQVHSYAGRVESQLAEAGIRVRLDDRSEKLGYKIREAQLQKIPYMLVVGGREAASETVALRLRTGEDLGALPIAEVGERIADLSASRGLEL